MSEVGQPHDGPSVLTGWRVWRLRPAAKSPGLYSVINGYYQWSPGVNGMESHISGGPSVNRLEIHTVPTMDCTCGLWMKGTRQEAVDYALLNYWRGGTLCIGEVRAWGVCVEHESGWRCERMQPVSLVKWLITAPRYEAARLADLEEMARLYDVPAIEFSLLPRMIHSIGP